MRFQLNVLMAQALNLRQEDVATAHVALDRHAPSRRLARDRQQIDELSRRLERTIAVTAERRHLALQNLVGRLTVLSPQATLARGYAVVRHTDSGQVLTNPDQAPATTPLTITLRDGELHARSVAVEGVRP
jgi:exodeoxyribonuclease VII large subunit